MRKVIAINKNTKTFDQHLESRYGKNGSTKRTNFEMKAQAFAIGEIIKDERKYYKNQKFYQSEMRKSMLLVLLFFNFYSFCQKWPSEEHIKMLNYKEVVGDTTGTKQKAIFLKFPMYPGGVEGVRDFIKNETRYPDTDKTPENNGRVLCSYVVNKTGEIVRIEILESAGWLFDREAIRVLKKMERWIPGKLEGQFVLVSYTQSFKF